MKGVDKLTTTHYIRSREWNPNRRMKMRLERHGPVSVSNKTSKYARCYVSMTQETYTALEQLTERQVHALVKSALPGVLKNLGVSTETLVCRFSRLAGCSCGCSPAYLLDGVEVQFDLHVTLKHVA